MAGDKYHRNALKPQNMTYEERVKNMKNNSKDQVNYLKKVIQPDDTSIMDNYMIFQHGMEIEKKLGRPLCYATVEELNKQIGDYIYYCYDTSIVPINTGLALWLGIAFNTMNEWKNNPTHPFSESIKRACEFFHSFAQQKTLDGQINPILYMFLSKNYWGMSDKTEIVHRSSTAGIDLDEQRRIIDSTPGIVIDAQFKEKEKTFIESDTNTRAEDFNAQKPNFEHLEAILTGDFQKTFTEDFQAQKNPEDFHPLGKEDFHTDTDTVSDDWGDDL